MNRKNEFVRELDCKLIDELKKEKLFQKNLLPDIKRGKVFPAIRKNRIDFYHKGGKLFSFDGKFSTHIKYASVYKFDKDYISELNEIKPIKSFSEKYNRIKENCRLYSGEEAEGVAALYSKSSYVKCTDDVVVLDIEIALATQDSPEHGGPEKEQKRRKQNRIDFLLYHKKKKILKFYEAKLFSNKEIWSKQGTTPKVIGQIERYNKQIKCSEKEIIKAYKNYVNIVNSFFNLTLIEPEKVDSNVILFIFGFDNDLLKGRFKELLKDDQSLKDVKYYAIGDVSGLKIDTLWNKIK